MARRDETRDGIPEISEVRPAGDDDWHAWDHLFAVLDSIGDLNSRHQEDLWKVLERVPDAENDYTLGLMHELERIPAYETSLHDSLRRTPTRLALIMLRRRLNAGLTVPPDVVRCLRGHATGTTVTEPLAEELRELLEHIQTTRGQIA